MTALLAQITPPPAGGDGIELPHVEWATVLPVVVLIGAALLLLTVSSITGARPRAGTYALFTVLAAGVALVASVQLWQDVRDGNAREAIAGAVVVDGFSAFFMVLVCSAVALGALIADGYLRREGLDGPEFYVLTLLSASGAMVMASANDLIVVFLGLEILSISLYVLAAFHLRRVESQEAAIKYFVLGSFSSAFFLYGVALTYGATGSTNLTEIAAFLSDNVVMSNGVLLAGIALLLVGLGFKVAAVPFHMWTPDVYQGSPSPVTGFMAAAAKAAGFAALLRIFLSAFGSYRTDWRPIVWALAVLTMVVGSVLAVVQSDVKRMLAYSSISHAGYVLVGLQAADDRGTAGALFYLLVYTFMILGSFAIVTLVGRRGDDRHALTDYRGLAARRPGLALAFTVFLLAQAGVPLTSGFLAKFYVISAAVEVESYALAIVAMLAATIAAFFYLRVIVVMYMTGEDDDDGTTAFPVPFGAGVALAVTLLVTLVVGVFPSFAIDFARDATLLVS